MKKAHDTCTFPGCEQKAFLHPHHVAHWTRDRGPTQDDNLIMLCTYHHTLVHEGGWSVILDAAAGPIFFRPSGRRYEPGVPAVDEAMRDEIDRELETETLPGATALEESLGIENFRTKEIGLGFGHDLYEVARNLAGV
jgi:hypothetical protein